MNTPNMNAQRELAKGLMAAAQPGVCLTPNKEPIRIGFKFRKPAGPLQDGNLHGDTTALETQTNIVYGGIINNATVLAESSGAVWCPGLERKCIQIYSADLNDLAAHPVLIQANILGSDLKDDSWVTISNPINVPGIYPIAVAASSAIPFMFEPEITLLRIIGEFNADAMHTGALPVSIQAVFSGYWGGVGKWVMRCVNSYEGV